MYCVRDTVYIIKVCLGDLVDKGNVGACFAVQQASRSTCAKTPPKLPLPYNAPSTTPDRTIKGS